MEKWKIDRGFADAGWEPDGTFSEHLSIGNSGDLCILTHRGTGEGDKLTFELYDVGRHVSYWVREIPSPEQAIALLEEHGETPEG